VMEDIDGWLLQDRPPRYVQLATAAAPEGDRSLSRWHDLGAQSAERLGVEQVIVDVRTREDADNPKHAAAIAGAGLIYLSGGNPMHLSRTLRGTLVWTQIMEQWRTSPGHRANLLAPGFTHVGYGVYRQGQRVIAVGAYAEVAARLAAPAPLRVASADAIAAALSHAAPAIRQFSVSEPGGEILTATYVEGRPESVLAPGAWQLRPHLSTGEHRYEVAWGPVFVLG